MSVPFIPACRPCAHCTALRRKFLIRNVKNHVILLITKKNVISMIPSCILYQIVNRLCILCRNHPNTSVLHIFHSRQSQPVLPASMTVFILTIAQNPGRINNTLKTKVLFSSFYKKFYRLSITPVLYLGKHPDG